MAGKGALGAALTALGAGVTKGAERTYSEQLNERIAKGKQSREDSLLKRRELFQTELAEKQHGFRLKEIETTQAGRLKTATDVATIKATAKGKKPPKHETFEIGDEKEVGGKLVKNVKVKARFDAGAADVGLGPGWVPVATIGIKDKILGDQWGYIRSTSKDYNKEQTLLNKQEQDILTLKEMLKAPGAVESHVVQNKLASLFSNQSRAIAEVEAWANLGNFVQRFGGGLKKFATGSLLESQYKDILNLVETYETDVLPKFSTNLNDHYTSIAEAAEVDPKLIIRKTLLDEPAGAAEVGVAPTVPKVGVSAAPTSASQIDEDAVKYGWGADKVKRTKQQWGFDTAKPSLAVEESTTEDPTRFR